MKISLKKIVRILVKRFQPKYKMEYREDSPEILHDKTIYIIGQTNNPWLVVLKCPCGCDSIIHLNLLQNANPRWSYKLNSKKKVSISPSVWRLTGCKSHFFIRGSKIEWVTNYRKRLGFHTELTKQQIHISAYDV